MPAPSSFDDENSARALVAKAAPGDNAAPLSITEISALLKATVEDRFGFVKLRGELSGFKRAASGHLYLRLKDEKAQIDGVMWRGNAGRLGFMPEDGLEVIASGKLTIYPGRSSYQIVIETMEIAGEGALLALLEKTKARLEAEGLFAPEAKRPLPYLPSVIGVVTSPTGAVIRDILHRLADRFPSHVLLWPVMVQGEGAALQIANAVRGFSEMAPGGPIPKPDLLIIGRGGGSVEDLWSFNEEIVVRAIAQCSIPTISAVGHETDTTLADYAADRRAPTPTAAAEMAVPVRMELAATLDEFGLRQRRAIMRPVSLGAERLQARAERLPRPEQLLAQSAQQLDDLSERLRRGLSDRAAKARQALQSDKARLSGPLLMARMQRGRDRLGAVRLSPALVMQRIASQTDKLAGLERLRLQLDPRAPLRRGYVLVTDADGGVIKRRAQAAQQPRLTLEFEDGQLDVVPGGAKPPVRRAAPRAKGAAAKQDDLFG